ncbi:MAG: hypothetical protein IT290_00775 [Deltaproteobacteria bacterium]|nr:hypothetical protein [Deltaproteobacteria bacterium]
MDTDNGQSERDGIAAELHEWAAVYESLGGATKAALTPLMKAWRVGKKLSNRDSIIAYFDEGISMEQAAEILGLTRRQLQGRLAKMPMLLNYRRPDKQFPRAIAWLIRSQWEVDAKRKPTKPVKEQLPDGFILLTDALKLFSEPPRAAEEMLKARRTQGGQMVVDEHLAQTIARRLNPKPAPATAEQESPVPQKPGIAVLRAANERARKRLEERADTPAAPPVGNFVRPGVYRRTEYFLRLTVDGWEARNILGLHFPEDVRKMNRARPVGERAQILTVEFPTDRNPERTEERWWRREIENIAKRKPVGWKATAAATGDDDDTPDDRDDEEEDDAEREFELPIRRSASR